MKSKGSWRGKPIEEYTKEELIDIVVQFAKELVVRGEQHIKDLDSLEGSF